MGGTIMNDTDVKEAGARARAIRDGALVDAGAAAAEAGIGHPVALSRPVWDRYVAAPDAVAHRDEAGRLRELLWMLRVAVERAACRPDRERENPLPFSLWVHGVGRAPERVMLRASFGTGDDREPVITITTADED
jgi:hypothetical protein